MSASDRLKEYRNKRMGMDYPEDGGGDDGDDKESAPSDRSVQLTDQELKSLAGSYQPGEMAECLVSGRISKDGMLDIMEIKPAGGGGGTGDGMPPGGEGGMPMMKMNPMLSPS